ncbi:aldo/keto reductase [Alkalibaculum sp. M08DMB]|uniref:Aldo/keto reductase n=1 Tax=Alkalibaculum sporogenes TaxID=2655001 RepID=A0A6A7K8M9_9FIRM|nr:aldo/keto reductase [Alkalibaculum sporogenes]MPW25756.1 aldo/keto reductase [Alkalibaculum sporogenes]
MLYRNMGNTDEKISILGYGCMRFPRKNGKIDEERAEKQVIKAIESGVNYFDTAYIYPGSEKVLGKILEKGYRDKVKIATKLPPYLVHSRKDMDKILEAELIRLRTDYIDYYLIHALPDMESWVRFKDLGGLEFLIEAQASGKVKHVGFSFHGNVKNFKKIVDDYPWIFCQIQYNYLDENYQAGREGMEYASQKGLGIIIMEPLRGGMLVKKMPDEVQKIWDCSVVKRTPAEWALKWIWNHPQVTTVLSGMNVEAHIEENIKIAQVATPLSLTKDELKLVENAKNVFDKSMKIGCTGCGYCMPCPVGVDIPSCFEFYNEKHMFGGFSMYMTNTTGITGGNPTYASLCVECGKCEQHCPQNLPIRQNLKDVSKDMEGYIMKSLVKVAKLYFNIKKRMNTK